MSGRTGAAVGLMRMTETGDLVPMVVALGDLAGRYRLTLADLVTYIPETQELWSLRLLETITHHGATAVIAPGWSHIGPPTVSAAVTAVADLIMPGSVERRRRGPEATS